MAENKEKNEGKKEEKKEEEQEFEILSDDYQNIDLSFKIIVIGNSGK